MSKTNHVIAYISEDRICKCTFSIDSMPLNNQPSVIYDNSPELDAHGLLTMKQFERYSSDV